ncbi:MAG: DUF1826 domain-containing protein [Rhodospirillaceae bacterium]
MTSLALVVNSDSDPATRVSEISGLHALRENSVPAVVLQRRIPEAFKIWIDGLLPDNLPWARVNLMTRDISAVARQACEEAGMPECPEREWFIDDIASLAKGFAGVMSAARLQLRFDVVGSNACKKFHTDVVKARLICTYRGPGTQYGVLTGGTDPDDIFDVRSGCPIVLRGKRWPNAMSAHFRHRSPPIQGLAMTRLNLVLDPLDDGEGCLHINPEWVREKLC